MANDRIFSDLSGHYLITAGTELAMNFYSLYEGWIRVDDERTSLDRLAGGRDFFEQTAYSIERIFDGGSMDTAGELARLYELRNRIKDKTLAFAAYSDRFKLYEYILNRAPGNLRGDTAEFNEDAAARDILTAVFSSQDNAAINDNIKTALGQLPLRMTKQRFFDILEDSVKKYIDGERSSLDRAEYMICSSAGIWPIACRLDDLDRAVDFFEAIDWSTASAEELKTAEERLRSVVKVLIDGTDLFQALAELVNLSCVYLINRDKADENDVARVMKLKPVIDEAMEGLRAGNASDMSDKVLECFRSLEGTLEPEIDKLSMLEAKLDTRQDLADTAEALELMKCRKLMSTSVFIDIDADEVAATTDEAYAHEVFTRMRDSFDRAFTGAGRQVNRARMAAALAELPVFFNSRTEVMNYVRESLSGCRDRYEKLVAVRLVLDALK